jgi:hypothetical protein
MITEVVKTVSVCVLCVQVVLYATDRQSKYRLYFVVLTRNSSHFLCALLTCACCVSHEYVQLLQSYTRFDTRAVDDKHNK